MSKFYVILCALAVLSIGGGVFASYKSAVKTAYDNGYKQALLDVKAAQDKANDEIAQKKRKRKRDYAALDRAGIIDQFCNRPDWVRDPSQCKR
jgi:hypothetical protein